MKKRQLPWRSSNNCAVVCTCRCGVCERQGSGVLINCSILRLVFAYKTNEACLDKIRVQTLDRLNWFVKLVCLCAEHATQQVTETGGLYVLVWCPTAKQWLQRPQKNDSPRFNVIWKKNNISVTTSVFPSFVYIFSELCSFIYLCRYLFIF